jgi:hypothetical protein
MIEYIYYLQYTYDAARVTQAMLCVTLRCVASDTENNSIKTTSIPGLHREKIDCDAISPNEEFLL